MLEEDKIVMYLIVRESINMTPGKLAAQAGHAVDKFCTEFMSTVFDKEYPNREKLLQIVASWRNTGSTKITLSADEKEWEKVKKEFYKNCFIVVDAGRTQLEPGTETVISLWPQYKSTLPKTIKRLQLHK